METAHYERLATFLAVAEEQSFTKAARRLNIAKGTVSRSIARLEEDLGVELVHRTTHAVALSTAGIALYERVSPHLTGLDQAVQKLPERGEAPSGTLRMTAPPDFGIIVLPEVIAHFTRRYEGISVDVRLTNVTLDLVADGFDLAIRGAGKTLKDSSLVARRVGDGTLELFAAPSYLARRGQPKHIGDPAHDWIVHSSVCGAIKPWRKLSARFVCDDFLLVRNLAREGAGVALLPRFVATPYLRDGLLEQVTLPDHPTMRGGLFLVYPSRGQAPRKVTAFRDFLIDWLKKWPLV
jgi:DNA-binding transcriptional LysR family regulator